ncbi:MAG TPA: 30S ribosomal protein S2 [Candidatus Moranbacteria bacterium]|nr:30S ribosomal protein S2 [Candidatus Moranbacteria bacterium]
MEENNNGSAGMADQNNPAKQPVIDCFSDLDFSKLEINLEDMFKGGVHFGHHKSRKSPKMSKYIFTTKDNINILDLEKTKEKLLEAMDFISKVISENQEVLFVGTKKQAKKIVEAAAKKCGMPYITERWLGGTFTNFSAISGRTRYLRDGLDKMKRGEYAKYTKFEQMKKAEELERLENKMGGIKDMMKLPGAVFIASIMEDELALKEAINKNIPVIALVDTNIDPGKVDYPIPANEDAVSSLKLMLSYVAKAVLDGKNKIENANDIIKEEK